MSTSFFFLKFPVCKLLECKLPLLPLSRSLCELQSSMLCPALLSACVSISKSTALKMSLLNFLPLVLLSHLSLELFFFFFLFQLTIEM